VLYGAQTSSVEEVRIGGVAVIQGARVAVLIGDGGEIVVGAVDAEGDVSRAATRRGLRDDAGGVVDGRARGCRRAALNHGNQGKPVGRIVVVIDGLGYSA